MTLLNNRKIVSNSFNNGIDLDSNPMVISNDSLTNCLNGTLITHNGNEFILQNDMGNGRVESAGLPAGYVPVGMKEFGGIVYVASKNVITGECLIGSFPSPERNISADEIPDFLVPLVPTIDSFCQDGEILNTVITTKIYPTILKPGDKFKVNISNQECDKTLLDYSLGIKITSGVEKRNWNIYYTDLNNLLEFQNDESYPPQFYEENSKGELYLITEVKLPKDIDITIIDVTDMGNSVARISFKVSGDPGQTVLIKYGNRAFLSVTLNDLGEWLTYEDVYTTVNDTYTIVASPVLQRVLDSNTTKQYRIKSMTKSLNINIQDEMSRNLLLNQWRYSFNEDSGVLDLTYGFSGALNIGYVNFVFYEYDDDSKRFSKYDDVLAEPRKVYSGLFTDVIAILNMYNLYMCEIVCKEKETSETILKSFYRLIWTNNILNEYNVSLDTFDNSVIELQSFINGNTSIVETGMVACDTNNEGLVTTAPVGTTYFEFSNSFEKKITFAPTYELSISNIHKLPFKYDNLLVESQLLPQDDPNSKLKAEYKINNVDSKISNFGDLVENKDIEVIPATMGDVRERTLKTTYYYTAAGVDVETESEAKVAQVVRYLDINKPVPEGHLSDMRKIFGNDSGLVLGVGISTGLLQNSKTDDIISRYGLLRLDSTVSGNNDFTSWGGNLARAENAANRAYDSCDRSWSEVISSRLFNKIKDWYGYVPPICCIGSFRCRGVTYGGDWIDGTANRDGGLIGFDYSDYTLITNYDGSYNFGNGYRNYIMPLWLDNGDLYRILINSTVKLMPNEGMAMGHSAQIIPDFGKSIVTPLKNLFSKLYVADPERYQKVSTKFAKSDLDHYSYTKEVTGTVTINEIIKFNGDIIPDYLTNDLYNEVFDTFIYTPNQSISQAVDAFFLNRNISRPEDFTQITINFNFPDIIENVHNINVPASSILNGVQLFLTANKMPEVASAALVYDQQNGDFVSKDGDGNDIVAGSIYYEHAGLYYPLSTHLDWCINFAYDGNGNQWAVRVSDLLGLHTKEMTVNGVKYNTIVWGSGSVGLESWNFDLSNNPCNWDCSLLPYIGLVNRDARDGKNKDRSETYPFSFVRGWYNGGFNNRNALFCVPLCLFPDLKRILTSTYRNNNIKPT